MPVACCLLPVASCKFFVPHPIQNVNQNENQKQHRSININININIHCFSGSGSASLQVLYAVIAALVRGLPSTAAAAASVAFKCNSFSLMKSAANKYTKKYIYINLSLLEGRARKGKVFKRKYRKWILFNVSFKVAY